jgi:hypothetical protein
MPVFFSSTKKSSLPRKASFDGVVKPLATSRTPSCRWRMTGVCARAGPLVPAKRSSAIPTPARR